MAKYMVEHAQTQRGDEQVGVRVMCEGLFPSPQQVLSLRYVHTAEGVLAHTMTYNLRGPLRRNSLIRNQRLNVVHSQGDILGECPMYYSIYMHALCVSCVCRSVA